MTAEKCHDSGEKCGNISQTVCDKTTPAELNETNVVTEVNSNRGHRFHMVNSWLQKYFLEGQTLSKQRHSSKQGHWLLRLVKQPRFLAVFIPFMFVQMIWWSCAIKYHFWKYFPDRYFLTITMIFGSIIAGMTSEGGASVAFPVMTLAFGIQPAIARDFSLMIQSCGMTAAAFTILYMRVVVEWSSIVYCTIGGLFGITVSLQYIDPNLTPPQKKLGFVSVWFSFAFALFLLNRNYKRQTFLVIPDMKLWKRLVLLLTGFVGGIFSAISGSGVDICSFSVLTLLFRVTEKTATPTSVVLMAGNTVIGFYWREVMMQAISMEAYYYLAVCAPVVVLGAPLGSLIGSHFHRLVLAALVYVTDTVALVSAFVIVSMTTPLIVSSVVIIVCGFLFFGLLSYAGHRLLVSVPPDCVALFPMGEMAAIRGRSISC